MYTWGCMKRIVQTQMPVIHSIPVESLGWVGSVPQMEVSCSLTSVMNSSNGGGIWVNTFGVSGC